VSHQDIDIDPNVIAWLNCLSTGSPGQDFFRQGHRWHRSLQKPQINLPYCSKNPKKLTGRRQCSFRACKTPLF
jgi:hypothetical protein